MPVKLILSLLISFAFSSTWFINHANASQALSLQVTRVGLQQKVAAHINQIERAPFQKSNRLNRLLKKAERKIYKNKNFGPEIDFTDPVQKWLWFGLFGLLLALILSIFNLGLGSLVAFLSVLCLIFWLLKLSNVV
jgi:hypothetical protein